MKKLTTLLMALAICTTSAAHAQMSESLGGYGYQEARRSPYIAPAVALATVAVIAIVAVAVNNSGHSSHSHSHQ